MDTLYYERSGGIWRTWTYSDGIRIFLLHSHDVNVIEAYAKKHQYQLVYVQ